MIHAVYTDIHDRIDAELRGAIGITSDESCGIEYGTLDDLAQRSNIRRVTVTIAPTSGAISSEADTPDAFPVEYEYLIGVHVETLRDEGPSVRAMQITDAIIGVLHGVTTNTWQYGVQSWSARQSTQSTCEYEISLTVYGVYQ